MTPTFISSSPPLFNGGSTEVDDDHRHKFFGPYNQAASSSSYSCHLFFNSTDQDQEGYYHTEFYQPQQQLEGNNYAAYGGSYELENKEKHENQAEKIPEKWMSTKMKLVQKMKNSDQKGVEKTKNNTMKRSEDQKQPTSSVETDQSSNSSSNNNGNTLIRVCSDCNTTKTPLWRSGPKGPKTLCNACGIRQRKARRAMAEAAAAAAANGTIQLQSETPTVKIKVHHKEKTKNNNNGPISTVPFKKRCKVIVGSSHQEPKKLGFEDYLINLSKNLAFQNMFPQDEKEAAILLMALSCGLVHS